MPQDNPPPRTSFRNGILVGSGWATAAVSLLLNVMGGSLFQGPVNIQQPLVSSGAGLQINVNQTGVTGTGRTYIGVTSGVCTATGGIAGKADYLAINQDYPTNDIDSSASGALVRRVTVNVNNAPVTTNSIECGFDSVASSTGSTALRNFTSVSVKSGSVITFSTGSILWRTNEDFQCGLTVNPTSAFSCTYDIEYSSVKDPDAK